LFDVLTPISRISSRDVRIAPDAKLELNHGFPFIGTDIRAMSLTVAALHCRVHGGIPFSTAQSGFAGLLASDSG